VSEAVTWSAKQPGHMKECNDYYAPHLWSRSTRPKHIAHWDGTMNMPIMRLADPKHKDVHMAHWV